MRKNVGSYERIVRLLLGGVLTYLALTRLQGKATGKVAMMAGLNLLTTGASQRCPVNAAVGRDTYRDRARGDTGAMGDLPA